MTTSQDFETQRGKMPYVDVVHAAGPATDVKQEQPRHWRPREPKVDHWCENHGPVDRKFLSDGKLYPLTDLRPSNDP